MTRSTRAKIIGLVLFATTPLLAWGQDLPAGATMLTPSELKWKPIPAPVGAQILELVGGARIPASTWNALNFRRASSIIPMRTLTTGPTR